jgi:hypothetical protein
MGYSEAILIFGCHIPLKNEPDSDEDSLLRKRKNNSRYLLKKIEPKIWHDNDWHEAHSSDESQYSNSDEEQSADEQSLDEDNGEHITKRAKTETRGPISICGVEELQRQEILYLWKKRGTYLNVNLEKLTELRNELLENEELMSLWRRCLKALNMDYVEPKFISTFYTSY